MEQPGQASSDQGQDSTFAQTSRSGAIDRGGWIVAGAAALAIAAMGLHLSGTALPWDHSADAMSREAREARTESFLASAPLQLLGVSPLERARATATMNLDPASRAALPEFVRLAWITLWDTDDEDGDTVRIDSAGYSRTVTLTKKGATFAVPIPGDGVINLTGVRDGEGGGITVGAASGSSSVVLPIMSVGQVIGLHVGSR